ncbi:MAG: HAD-IB family phosphatase, partial [Bowdeniella nasicola]|nr:HAD-IB family phosphatase [Bowdeniella nasicola]
MSGLRGLTPQRFTLVSTGELPEHLLPDIASTLTHLGWVRRTEERTQYADLNVLHYRGYTPTLIAPHGDSERLLTELRSGLTALSVACSYLSGKYTEFVPTRAVFDMDATVIAEESLDQLATHCGHGPACAAITERAMAGELDFAAALRERVALLAGTPVAACREIGRQLTVRRGAIEVMGALQAHGCDVVIASGGFHQIITPVVAKLPVDQVVANTFAVSGEHLTGAVDG